MLLIQFAGRYWQLTLSRKLALSRGRPTWPGWKQGAAGLGMKCTMQTSRQNAAARVYHASRLHGWLLKSALMKLDRLSTVVGRRRDGPLARRPSRSMADPSERAIDTAHNALIKSNQVLPLTHLAIYHCKRERQERAIIAHLIADSVISLSLARFYAYVCEYCKTFHICNSKPDCLDEGDN